MGIATEEAEVAVEERPAPRERSRTVEKNEKPEAAKADARPTPKDPPAEVTGRLRGLA